MLIKTFLASSSDTNFVVPKLNASESPSSVYWLSRCALGMTRACALRMPLMMFSQWVVGDAPLTINSAIPNSVVGSGGFCHHDALRQTMAALCSFGDAPWIGNPKK